MGPASDPSCPAAGCFLFQKVCERPLRLSYTAGMTGPSAEIVYLFRHAVVRDAAYELQPPGERAQLHAFVLSVLESVLDDPAAREPWAYDLAEHARLAQLGREGVPAEFGEKQFQYLVQAAGFAKKTYNSDQGIEVNRAIAEHPRAEPQQRARAQEDAASYLMKIGRLDEARELVVSCVAEAEACGANAVMIDASSTLGVIHLDQGRFDEGFAVISRAVEVGEQDGTPELLAKAYGALARFYDASDQIEKAEEVYNKVVELGRNHNMHATEGVALVNLGGLLQESGRSAEARSVLLRAVELLTAPSNLRARAVALGNLGWVQQNNREADAAEKTLLSAVEVATRTGSRYDLAVILGNLANVYLDQERSELALRTYRRALELHLELGTKRHEGIVRGDLGFALEGQGKLDEAEQEYLLAIALGEEMRNTRGVYIAKIHYSHTLRRLRRMDESLQQLKEGYALAVERKDWMWVASAEEKLCGHVIDSGDDQAAQAAYFKALNTTREHNPKALDEMQRHLSGRYKEAFGREPQES